MQEKSLKRHPRTKTTTKNVKEIPKPMEDLQLCRNDQKLPTFSTRKNREKLSGGNFRKLNEKLYTCPIIQVYQQQMTNWPELPVNSIISWLSSRSSSLVVGEMQGLQRTKFSPLILSL
ncbi:hypothetical protein F2Q68_00045046 [Brassica cretica]|uniref:Ribosomal RNA-processing protein 8 n=1 Tax=Brassica cretica TaxID=69181 RepID=A0A8S9LJ32_BRACR|nr:hypothetical protein F2Q68_00045046 [Brassica cretica]